VNGPLEEKTYGLLEDLFFSKKYTNPDGSWMIQLQYLLIVTRLFAEKDSTEEPASGQL
jgi:hypothetical protein